MTDRKETTMEPERNHLNPHNIDPGRIDRAPGFDSVRPGQSSEEYFKGVKLSHVNANNLDVIPGTDEMPPEMTADQAVRVIKAMGKHIVDGREPRPGALDIVDAVALAVGALRRAEK